jgi:hypothetical protein
MSRRAHSRIVGRQLMAQRGQELRHADAPLDAERERQVKAQRRKKGKAARRARRAQR